MFLVTIGGKSAGVVSANGSADDLTALQSLIEGKVEIYDKKGEGGTSITSAPAKLNAFRFGVGKKDATDTRVATRASVKIPHVKVSKDFKDIRPAVVGEFDASFESSVKCDYANLYYNKAEGV